MSRSRTVLIAGAGIGGLAAALALANNGFRAVVLERDSTPDTSGAGIQLSPNATRALAAFGALDAVAARAIEPEELVAANAINRAVLAKMPLGARMREGFGSPYLVCLRADLSETLAALAREHPDIELRYGHVLTDFASHSRGVTAQVERNRQSEETTGIALIGADGIRSRARLLLHPGARARYGGMSAYRATISRTLLPEDLQAKVQVRVWLAPRSHLVHYPVGDGSLVNLVAVTEETDATESWGEEVTADKILPRLPRWSEALREIIARAGTFRRWSIFETPPLSFWGKGNITLLGDAAHGMFPFLAQGAGSALEDAVALARNLKDATDIAKALRAYERTRAARTQKMQAAARDAGRIYHLGSPWWHGRDAVMERIGGEGLIARNAWIYRG